MTRTVQIVLPYHLRNIAKVADAAIMLEVDDPVTVASMLDALEARYPALRGAIRDHATRQRRPFVRFFACQEDLSHEPTDTPLPESVASGTEPLLVVGAISGG